MYRLCLASPVFLPTNARRSDDQFPENSHQTEILRPVPLDHERGVAEHIFFVQNGGIQEQSAVRLVRAVALVDVPGRADFYAQILHPFQQIAATDGPLVGHHFVQNAVGRAMHEQNIGVRRNQIPVPPDVRAALAIERPIKKPGLDGASPNADARDFGGGIFEVNHVRGQQGAENFGVSLGQEIVVAGNQNLVRVRLRGEPIEESLHFFKAAPARKIARVQQHIARRHGHLRVLVVGIGDENQSHFMSDE